MKCQSNPLFLDPLDTTSNQSTETIKLLIVILLPTYPSLCAVNVNYPIPASVKEMCLCFPSHPISDFLTLLSPASLVYQK